MTIDQLPSTGVKPHSVSYSETSTYLQCRRKWEYGYGRSLQRITESHSLALGGTGHTILQSYYEYVLEHGDGIISSQEIHDNAVEQAMAAYDKAVSEGYQDDDSRASLYELLFEYYFPNEPLVNQGWQILAVEQEFVLDTVLYEDTEETIRTPFVIDLVAYDPEGRIVVIDHKFLYDFLSHDEASLAPQIPLYIGGLRALNYRVDYGMYNMLRTRKVNGGKMKKPELLAAVNDAITEAGGSPQSDYDKPTSKMTIPELTEIAEAYEIEAVSPPEVSQKMQLLDIHPNTSRVKRTFLEQLDTAQEILELQSLPDEERDIKMHRVANRMVCRSCSFYDLCQTELVGGNVDIVLRTEYKIRERRTFDEETAEYEAG